MARLIFKSVDASIGTSKVLRNINFSFEIGQTIALIGRNGAGKTSLLRTILGLTDLTSGNIVFDGSDLGRLPVYKRASLGIGYVPEDRRLIGKFSVIDNIRLGGWANKIDQSEFDRKLVSISNSLPDIVELKNRTAGELSGGQQKMVALARALVCGTKMLLLDEPFQGLAPVVAKRYADSLNGLRSQYKDLTIVITESNPTLLVDMSDRSFTIERGELVDNS